MARPDYHHITSRCFVNAPWYELKDRYLDLFLNNRIQPEIGLEGLCLYKESPEEFERIAALLRGQNLACTLHAPFFDLAPGALDPKILEASRNKLRLAFDLIEVFRPRSVVCHLNYEKNKQGYKEEEWRAAALATWQELSDRARKSGTVLMLENTYERSPEAHEAILSTLDSPHARFCLDVGHLMSFAHAPWQDWLPRLASWLGQLHLHDNNGESDQHLGLGLGVFDFQALFDYLGSKGLHPLVTLEPHSEEDLWQALEYLDRTSLLDRLQ